MVTFLLSLVALVLGYFVYGRIVERVFAPDNRPTPAVSMADGVDYVVLPGWKIFMIQFLNIAGTGPIFGAIMGAKFGPSAYLWIVFGCIFAGAVHDYLSGMLSVRNGGARLVEDTNGNGVWDTGLYAGKRQPEQVYYYPQVLELKANFDLLQDWNVLQLPLDKQKPNELKKQKPDEDKKKNRNRNSNRSSSGNSGRGYAY